MAWVVLAGLTLLAALAAVAVALRTRPSSRAELALTSIVVWNALIVAPIYGLGLPNVLTRWTLGPTAGAFFLAVLFAAGRVGTFAESARALGAAVASILALPFEAIAIARRARSLVVGPLVLSAVLLAYTAFASYFTPSWRQWDSLWYHEPIISWTIQNHGFKVVDLSGDLQKANGYPRLAEMTHLWFVIFTDRRLVELLPSLIAPGLLYATYLLVRRFSRDRVSAMGFACVVLLMPTTSYLLQSTYVDIQVAFLVVAGTYYATRSEFRVCDAWLTTTCVSMAIGAKYLVLPSTSFIAVIALCRLIAHQGWRRATVATALGGFAVIIGAFAVTLGRNWLYFKNPLWPDFQYDNQKYGIHLPFVSFGGTDPLNMNMPLRQLVELMTSIPYSMTKGLGPKGILYDYGFAVIFTVFPAAFVGLAVAAFFAARDAIGRVAGIRRWSAPDAWNALFVALPMVASLATTPALWAGRYHIADVAVLPSLIAYAARRGRWPLFTEGLVSAAALMSLVVFYWVEPRWWLTPTELAKLASIPYPEREVTAASTLSPTLDIHAGAAITREVGLAREAHLHKGDVVVFDERVHWIGLLWNNDYSNKVVYVPEGPDFAAKVDALGAKWVFCRAGDPMCNAFRGKPEWRELQPYSVESGWGSVMERVR